MLTAAVSLTDVEDVERVLSRLATPAIRACAVLSEDGYVLSQFGDEPSSDEVQFGAHLAQLWGDSDRAGRGLARGRASEVLACSKDGYLVLGGAPNGMTLACWASPEAKLGVLLFTFRSVLAELVRSGS